MHFDTEEQRGITLELLKVVSLKGDQIDVLYAYKQAVTQATVGVVELKTRHGSGSVREIHKALDKAEDVIKKAEADTADVAAVEPEPNAGAASLAPLAGPVTSPEPPKAGRWQRKPKGVA